MSTKSSIAYGDDFHVYEDLADDPKRPRPVYIQLEDVISCDVFTRAVDGKLVVGANLVIAPDLWQRIVKSALERK